MMLNAPPAAEEPQQREPLLPAFAGDANPIGLDGIEFIEYATAKPQALGQVLEMMGFRPVARHRSREVLLYRQGALNIVINAHAANGLRDVQGVLPEQPQISAIALRVRDARAAYAHLLERGGWEVQTRPELMELNIPAIHGPGDSRIYLVDRYRDFSIYDVDFIRIPGVDPRPQSTGGIGFFGIVQYIGPWRTDDWSEFYRELFGAQAVPDDHRFGILPDGHLLRMPGLSPGQDFMIQLVEPPSISLDATERLQRIGLAVPDVTVAVQTLRALGMEFVESEQTHTDPRGALTKTYLGSVAFELVLTRS